MRFQKFFRHDVAANQGFHAPYHALTGNTCVKHQVVHVELQLFYPVFRGDVYAHGFRKVMDTKYHVLNRVVLQQFWGNFERFRVLNNRLYGDVRVNLY